MKGRENITYSYTADTFMVFLQLQITLFHEEGKVPKKYR